MNLQCLIRELEAKYAHDKDPKREDVERAILSAAQSSLLIEPEQNGEARHRVKQAEGDNEELGEPLKQVPHVRIEHKVPPKRVRVQHGHYEEENEGDDQNYVEADATTFRASARRLLHIFH